MATAFVAGAHGRRCAQNSDGRELELPDEWLARHTFQSIELGKSSNLKYARGCGDLAQDLLAGLIARVPIAWRQVSTDGSEHSVQLHDGVLMDTNVLGNGDALPLGLFVLSIDNVHRRTASRLDVVKRQRPVSEEPEAWVSERTQHVSVVDVLDDEAKAFLEALPAACTCRVSLVAIS